MIPDKTLSNRLTDEPLLNIIEVEQYEIIKAQDGWFYPTYVEQSITSKTRFTSFCESLYNFGYLDKQPMQIELKNGQKRSVCHYRYFKPNEFNPNKVGSYYRHLLGDGYVAKIKLHDF